MRFAFFVNDQARPPGARVLLALGEVKIPCPENVRADTHVAEVGVITFERAFSAKIGPAANLDSRVAFCEQPVLQS